MGKKRDTIYRVGSDRRARRRQGALSGALGTERLRWIWWFYSPGGNDERKRETLEVVWTRRGVKRGDRATGGAQHRRGRGHVRARHELDEKVRGGCAVARGWLVGARVTRGHTGSWVASRLGEKRRGRERAGWLGCGRPRGAAALAGLILFFFYWCKQK